MRFFHELARSLAEVVDHSLQSLSLLRVLDGVQVDGSLVGAVVEHVESVHGSLKLQLKQIITSMMGK